MITALNTIIERSSIFNGIDRKSIIVNPTGDGMVIGFPESKEQPYKLALEIQKALLEVNKTRPMEKQFNVRIGLHSGDVYPIKNIRGENDVCGPGIIFAQRIMAFGDAGHILASDKIAEDLKKLSSEYAKTIHHLGVHSAKQGEEISIYNIYGDDFGNPNSLPNDKIISILPLWDFLDAKVKLEVVDPGTILTHHVISTKMKNVSRSNISSHFLCIEGDVDKDWDDLSIDVEDHKGRSLVLSNIIRDDPHRKEFCVRFAEPVKPGEQVTVSLKWDWEEPKRFYDYFLGHDSVVRNLDFSFESPNLSRLKPEVHCINAESGGSMMMKDGLIYMQRTNNGGVRFQWATTKTEKNQIFRLAW